MHCGYSVLSLCDVCVYACVFSISLASYNHGTGKLHYALDTGHVQTTVMFTSLMRSFVWWKLMTLVVW